MAEIFDWQFGMLLLSNGILIGLMYSLIALGFVLRFIAGAIWGHEPLTLASLIAGRRLPLVHGYGTHPLVAAAEFALIGDVPPRLRRPEGPFGDHYGYYSLQHDYPVFRVETMACRRDALYPATVVGKPRQEDFYIGDLLQELLSPLFPLVMPAVEQLWSYGETGYHSLAGAVVKQRSAWVEEWNRAVTGR